MAFAALAAETATYMADIETSHSLMFGPSKSAMEETQHAAEILSNLETRVQEGLVTVSVNHVQLNVILRQLMLVIQIQARVLDTNTTQWKAAVRDLHVRCDNIQSNIQGLKDVVPSEVRALRGDMAAAIQDAVQAAERRLEDEIDEVIADVNRTLEETNQNINHELQRMASVFASSRETDAQASHGEYLQLQQDFQSKAARLEAAVTAVHRPGRLEAAATGTLPRRASAAPQREARPPVPGPDPDPDTEEGRAGDLPAATESLPENVGVSLAPTTLLPTGTPGLAPSLSSPPATMSSPTTKIAATCASPKVNAAWVREQLAAKADTDFVQRQGRNIDELFTLATGLSQTLERLAAHLAALTDGRSLDEAFELRVDNLTNEVVRLDKCKADRGELQLWLDRAATAASMTRTGYQCLSCNRVTGPIRTATRQKPPDFPPSTLALSALQPKGSPGPPGDLGSVRMLQRLTPTHPRKKLDQFYDWMQTRAEDDRLSHPHPHRGPTPNEPRPPSPPSPGREGTVVPPADGTPAHEAGPTPREPDPNRLSRTQPDRPSRRTPLSIHGRGVG